jgi:hypothetical protein
LDTSKQCNNDISLFWSKDCQESREYLRKLMLLRATEKINLLRKTVSSAAKASRLKFSDIARAIPAAAVAAAAIAVADSASPAIGPTRSLATAIASALGLLRPIPFSSLPRLGFTSVAAGLLPVTRGLSGLSGLNPLGPAPLPGLGLGLEISRGPIGLTGLPRLAGLSPSGLSPLPSLFRRDDMATRARRRALGMRPVAAAAAVRALHPIPAP